MTTASTTRLSQTATFRGPGLSRWAQAALAVFGGGMLGSRFTLEAVRSGASVRLYDFDDVAPHNNLAVPAEPGKPKVDAIVAGCEVIRSGSATGRNVDVRHVGIGELSACDLLIDLTDDPRLAFALTQISNGLQIPLLRAAVDGSGRWELGRVLCSDPREGGACQMCPRSFHDLSPGLSRTSCPGTSTADRPPTLAGPAIASTIVGVALLQAQRIITGNDLELVRDREVIVDLSHQQILAARISRSENCISGHDVWQTTAVPAEGCSTLKDVFHAAERLLGHTTFSLEPYNHPLCVEARCVCGAQRVAPGTIWTTPPTCSECGQPMIWRTDTQVAVLDRELAVRLGALTRSLPELGLPTTGAMFVARIAGQTRLRMVLNGCT